VGAKDNYANLNAAMRAAQAKHPERTPGPVPADSEARLDALLRQSRGSQDNPKDSSEKEAPPMVALIQFRELLVRELSPVVDDLCVKYAPSGVTLRMIADKIINGGRNLTIEIEYNAQGMRLDGTVRGSVIAFQQTRYSHTDRAGLTASGSTLRIRDLNADMFRAFLCDRIASLVRSALRH